MDVRNLVVERDSEADFWDQFAKLVSASVSVIQVRTHEAARTIEVLRRRILCQEEVYHEWDIVNGKRTFNMQNRTDPTFRPEGGPQFVQLPAMFEHIWQRFEHNIHNEVQNLPTEYFVMVGAHYFFENNPVALQRIMNFAAYFVNSNIKVVLITGPAALPASFQDHVVSIDFERPGHAELAQRIRLIFDDVSQQPDVGETFAAINSDEQISARLAIAGAGMTSQEFDTALSRSVVEALSAFNEGEPIDTDSLIEGVSKQKTEVVKKNDLLEVMQSESMQNVGGMENLKEWVSRRARCYSKEAAEFGIEPPKGLVLVGVPGTGKSLAAKAVASEFGIPLIRLDFSKVFNSLVGSSEQRMRTALQMIEAMAPCVCFADEVDKGLGGIGNGGGDAGTSMRVLGVFLTWLQECRVPVFTIVTANNITGLPPELLRRGRFDAIFSTTLPTATERKEVLDIHLARRGRSIDEFTDEEVQEFLDKTNDYVPAEIEAAVKDGLVLAFNEREPKLTIGHLIAAAGAMVPLARSHAGAIAGMVEWAKNNAIPASYTDAERARAKPATRRRIGVVAPSKGNVRRLDTTRRRNPKDKE